MASTYWTIALQAINFLVLVWLLQRFLYKPVLSVIESRRAISDHALAEAAAAKEAAERERQSLELDRSNIVAERDSLIEKAAAEAARERELVIERARDEALAIELENRRQIERERAELQDTVIAEAAKLAVGLSRRLLTSSAPSGALDPFLERAVAKLASMPSAERERLLAPGEGLLLVSAASIGEAQRAACMARIAAVLGRPVAVSFAVSPELIAGIELRFPRAVLRHNWHEELSDALKELTAKDVTEPTSGDSGSENPAGEELTAHERSSTNA